MSPPGDRDYFRRRERKTISGSQRLFWIVAMGVFLALGSVAAVRAQEQSLVSKLNTGKDIYNNGCFACHGPDGRGQAKAIAGFEPPATFPDFTDCPTSTPEPDVQWRAIVTNGGPARAFSEIMPSFKDLLTEQQIRMVVDYLRSLCTEKSWPLGNFNLPRPLVTEKAFPESEAVLTSAANLSGVPEGGVTAIFERRIGSSAMVEFSVPFQYAHDPAGTHSSFGDIALAYKRKLIASNPKGFIWSAGGEIIAPTGNRAIGTGGESTVFELFTAFGKLLPHDSFVQAHTGFELPLHPSIVPRAYYFRTALGKTFAGGNGLGRRWTPMSEFIVDRDLVTGARTNLDVIPQIQIPINKRLHILADIGVRIPANNTAGRPKQLMFYLLWDYVDGGLKDGWR